MVGTLPSHSQIPNPTGDINDKSPSVTSVSPTSQMISLALLNWNHQLSVHTYT